MKPKLSVVLTTHNRLKRLKKSVKAIQDQTFKEFELIIVDDGSDDGTDKYVEKLIDKDKRIKYIKRDKNFGQHTRPKNEGTKAAKTNYIAYCDDDVIYTSDHLQVLWKAMEKEDKDCVYGDRTLIDETKKFSKQRVPGIRADFNIHQLGMQNFIDTSDVLCKKEAIEKVGGWDETLKKFADWNLWVRMAKGGATFKRVPKLITDYYVHKGCNQFKTAGMTFDPHACNIWAEKTLYGEAPKKKVAIYTLTYNRLDATKIMFEEMRKKTKYDFDHYFVDNNSTDGTQEWLKKNVDKDKLILNDENKGISKGSNQAVDKIMEGDYDIIMKMDNDVKILTDEWLEAMIETFDRNEMVVLGLYPEGLIDNPGGVPRKTYGYIGDQFIGIVPHLGGMAVAGSVKTHEDFRWKENDFLHGIQDYEYSQHCQEAGYTLMYLENVKAQHMEKTENKKEKTTKYEKKD